MLYFNFEICAQKPSLSTCLFVVWFEPTLGMMTDGMNERIVVRLSGLQLVPGLSYV